MIARALRAPRGPYWLLWIAGPALLAYLIVVRGGDGWDTLSYWRIPFGADMYAGANIPTGAGIYRYSPAFAQALMPSWVLPWAAFRALWLAGSLLALALVAGRWTLPLLLLPPVWLELYIGNIHLLLALAIASGFRWPAAWAFVLLTKVTPGIGLLWFAVRREWRALAVATIVTAGVVALSISIGGASIWAAWIESLKSSRTADDAWIVSLPPLTLRLAAAAALVIWGAWSDRRWTVPVGAVLALPTIWGHGLAMLVALIPEWESRSDLEPAARSPGTRP
jgi:hypothetical protein